MSYYFPLILTLIVVFSGVVYALDMLVWSEKRKTDEVPAIIDYSRSLFPVLLIVLIIRSFLFQPYRVPTGSLEPTVLPNDFLLVTQYSYGLRWPVINKQFLSTGKPKVGDIAVFRFPLNPKVDFVKRVVGVPGDQIEYINKVLYLNGKEATQTIVGPGIDIEDNKNIPVTVKKEDLNGVEHEILVNNNTYSQDFSVTVPDGYYFMMGDNRDSSYDSRDWGFVPEENLVGKGLYVLISWNSETHRPRWDRFGNKL